MAAALAMAQAKALGDELVVGLIPDSEILRCKGPPVMSEEERHTLVESVKWVDEIITGERPRPGGPQAAPPWRLAHACSEAAHRPAAAAAASALPRSSRGGR
jgi:cytidyltransferase-like protein